MSAVLTAKERKEFRNSSLREVRKNGNIPAVLYGKKVENKSVYVSSADLTKTIREVGRNGVISLDLDGQKHDVVLTDFQEDAMKKEIIHADFLAVDQSSKINVEVRLNLVGEARGTKDGGVLQQPLHQISISATPSKIPSQIEVDISNLQVGENVMIGDIPTMGQYSIQHDVDEVVVSILPPKQEEEINAGEKQADGHPENEEGRETTPIGE